MTVTLEQLITDDRVRVRANVSTWESAVATAAAPLVDDESIEAGYVDAIVTAANTFGPYFVLTPHVALAHARPEDGVRRLAISVATFDPPIAFGSEDNDPVSVVFCLAATSSDVHLQALRSLVAVMGDPERIDAIAGAQDVAEVQRALRGN